MGEGKTPIQEEHNRQDIYVARTTKDNGTRNLKNEQTTARNKGEMKFGTWGAWDEDLRERKNEKQGRD